MNWLREGSYALADGGVKSAKAAADGTLSKQQLQEGIDGFTSEEVPAPAADIATEDMNRRRC